MKFSEEELAGAIFFSSKHVGIVIGPHELLDCLSLNQLNKIKKTLEKTFKNVFLRFKIFFGIVLDHLLTDFSKTFFL